MKIKKLLVATLLFVSSYSFSQNFDANGLLEFNRKKLEDRTSYLSQKGWKKLKETREENFAPNQFIVQEITYQYIDDCEITIISDSAKSYKSTGVKLFIPDENLYNKLVSEFVKMGYKFTESLNEEGNEVYQTTLDDGSVVVLEKEMVEGMDFYYISITKKKSLSPFLKEG